MLKKLLFLFTSILLCVPICGCGSSQVAGTLESTSTETSALSTAAEEETMVTLGEFTISGNDTDLGGDGSVSFRKTVTLDVESHCSAFNRMTIDYSSDQPLAMTAVYETTDGNTVEDTLYLEAGTEQSFSFLILGYLDGVSAERLDSVSFRSCNGEPATLRLSGMETESRAVLDGTVYTVSGERYDVGIKLAWGGGICSIIDKNNPVEGVSNLVNQYDTGRLIQQSYYGTGANGEYTPGTFNGSTWAYNPVQGGNQYNQPSRLIDVTEMDGAVYVKCQPADWSNKDYLTPSYMENVYTVEDDRIIVDNRFMDFSGWDQGCSTQEIPAFYTLSYFGTFVHYTGTADWTGDELTYERNLQFWGDSRYHADCDFRIRSEQTETWCAWVNEKDDYGIGLYVPNCDSLLAGRNAYNGSKDPYNAATNYVAPVNRFSIGNFKPVTYSYLITTGSVDEIRSVFTEYKDFTDNASLKVDYISMRSFEADYTDLVFGSTGMTSAFSTDVNSTSVTYSEEQSAVVLTCTGGDPYAGIDYDNNEVPLSADDYKQVSVTYMIPEENSQWEYSCELFLCSGDTSHPTAGISTVYEGMTADGKWHTAEIDLSGLDFWAGDIHEIRFDYFNSAEENDCIYIKEIKLS